jgi:predicted ATPase/DNA-binding NarL/FixJ family response regulator
MPPDQVRNDHLWIDRSNIQQGYPGECSAENGDGMMGYPLGRPTPLERAGDELSTREAALTLGRNVRSIRRAIERGELIAVKRGSAYWIAADDLLRYAAQAAPGSRSQRGRIVALPNAPPPTASLPQPLSSFIGRAAAIRAVLSLLEAPAVRVLTLTGPGGIGKTRLALAAADAARDRFPDGVAFVELAAVSRPDRVLPAICQTLGLREVAGRDRRQQLGAFLREKHLLLIVDNLEHLLAAAPQIAEIAVKAPGVTLLATSRAPLRVTGEHELPVTPMPLPPAGEPVTAASLLASDAARLFFARAQAHDPTFSVTTESAPLIADICARLDGLPLAIELAAARIKVLPPRQLRDRLERRLPLLIGGVRNGPQRHRTMRDAIAWSYDLLSPAEQRLFRCLAVFAGGCTLEAAEWVGRPRGQPESEVGGESSSWRESPSPSTILDHVSSLVDQGFLVRESGPDSEPRYRMLEIIREYGLECLEPDEVVAVRTAHARYFLAFAQALRPLANTQATSAVFERLAADDANLHLALTWLDERGPAADFVAMVAACCVYWYALSHLREAEMWIARALAKEDRATARDRARLLMAHGEQLMVKGDYVTAEAVFVAGFPLVRTAGDPFDIAMAQFTHGVCLTFAGKDVAGEEALSEALTAAEAIADPTLRAAVTAGALANLSVTARSRGDLALAESRSEAALRLQDELSFDLAAIRSLVDLGEIAREQQNYLLATERYLTCVKRTGMRGEKRLIADALSGIAIAAAVWGQSRTALLLFGAADALREREGIVMMLPADAVTAEAKLGTLHEALGEEEFAATLAEGRAIPESEVVTLAAKVAPPAESSGVASTSGKLTLTHREQDVLRLLAAGQTDREIADALFIGLRTVSWHVSAILDKLEATTRREAVERARAAGLI